MNKPDNILSTVGEIRQLSPESTTGVIKFMTDWLPRQRVSQLCGYACNKHPHIATELRNRNGMSQPSYLELQEQLIRTRMNPLIMVFYNTRLS